MKALNDERQRLEKNLWYAERSLTIGHDSMSLISLLVLQISGDAWKRSPLASRLSPWCGHNHFVSKTTTCLDKLVVASRIFAVGRRRQDSHQAVGYGPKYGSAAEEVGEG